MRYSFIHWRIFTALVKSYRLTMEDIRAIENAIMEDPTGWPVMGGTAGVRKMRFSPQKSSGGKSGGLRVCYLLMEGHRHVHLITIFAKSDASNLTAEQKQQISTLVREIKNLYSRGN